MISFTFLAIAGISILIYYFFFKSDGKKYPNGPMGLPVIGNAHQMRGHRHVKLAEWADKYGDIYQIRFGNRRCYVLTDLALMKEVYNNSAFAGKINDELFTLFSDGPHGLLNSAGPEWLEQRRFTLRHLRDFGFGKKAAEELIMIEVNEFLGNFLNQLGRPVTLNRTFQMAVMNTLWQIMAGVRYEQDDPRLWAIFNKKQELVDKSGRNVALYLIPYLAKSFPSLSGWNDILRLVKEMRSVTSGHVKYHEKTLPADGASRDFIDAYLYEIRATTDPNSSFFKENGIRSLLAVMGDLFNAGFETVTLTLSWALLYLVRFPEVQKKLQKELDTVVGRNRHPALADRPSLPYVEATITETLRYSSILPFNSFQTAVEDSKIRGYDIPKGTWIISTVHRLHFDEGHFPNPLEFNPDRFISNDGKFQKPDAIMAFGTGKRVCLGETLARDQLFLFLSNMFHRFDIRAADENPNPTIEPLPGFFLTPQDHKVILTERK